MRRRPTFAQLSSLTPHIVKQKSITTLASNYAITTLLPSLCVTLRPLRYMPLDRRPARLRMPQVPFTARTVTSIAANHSPSAAGVNEPGASSAFLEAGQQSDCDGAIYYTPEQARNELELPDFLATPSNYTARKYLLRLEDMKSLPNLGLYFSTDPRKSDGNICEVICKLSAKRSIRACGRGESKDDAEEAASLVLISKLHQLHRLPLSSTITGNQMSPMAAIWRQLFEWDTELDALPTLEYLTEREEPNSTISQTPPSAIKVSLPEYGIEIMEEIVHVTSVVGALRAAADRFGRVIRARLSELQDAHPERRSAAPRVIIYRAYSDLRRLRHFTIEEKERRFFPDTIRLYSAQVIINGTSVCKPTVLPVRSWARAIAYASAVLALQRQAATDHDRLVNRSTPELGCMANTKNNSALIHKFEAGVLQNDVHQAPTRILYPWKDESSPARSGAVDIAQDCLLAIARTLNNAYLKDLPDKIPLTTTDLKTISFSPAPLFTEKALESWSTMLQQEQLSKQWRSPFKERLAERSKLPLMEKDIQDRILELVHANDIIIIVGTTGSGKTTQVPQIILDDAVRRGEGAYCNIECTQPRRIAATAAARRVAYERSEPLQCSVGYHVRFQSMRPQSTGSINYCTAGIFLRKFLNNPDALTETISHLIIDEVHERNLTNDFLLATLRKVFALRRLEGKTNPKVILMSATINTELFARYFEAPSEAPPVQIATLSVPTRNHSVQKIYLTEVLEAMQKSHGFDHLADFMLMVSPESRSYIQDETKFAKFNAPNIAASSENTIEAEDDQAADGQLLRDPQGTNPEEKTERAYLPIDLIALVVGYLVRTTITGDILVFLPGMFDLEQMERYLVHNLGIGLVSQAHLYKVHKLHSLRADTNDEVFERFDGHRKIILATNIAETSITLPEVQYVVDSGKETQSWYDPTSGTTSLGLYWISKTNATQREGRAGRLKDGHYFAVFSEERFNSFTTHGTPEMLRADLSEVCLRIRAQKMKTPIEEFLASAIEPPSSAAVRTAISQLIELGALTENESITPLGTLLVSFPVDPRLGKMVMLGLLFRCLEPMLILASIVPGFPLYLPSGSREEIKVLIQAFANGSGSDLISTINAYRQCHAELVRGGPEAVASYAKNNHLSVHGFWSMDSSLRQLYKVLADTGLVESAPWTLGALDMIPPDLNTNAGEVSLIKALALSAYRSNIAYFWPRYGHGWLTKSDARSLIHPESGNSSLRRKGADKKRQKPGDLITFVGRRTMIDQKYRFLTNTTQITSLTALLFGGPLRINEDVLTIDDWLPICIGTADDDGTGTALHASSEAARMVYEFRTTVVDRFFARAFADVMNYSDPRYDLAEPKGRGRRVLMNKMFLDDNPIREAFISGIVDILRVDSKHPEAEAREAETPPPEMASTITTTATESSPPAVVIVGENTTDHIQGTRHDHGGGHVAGDHQPGPEPSPLGT